MKKLFDELSNEISKATTKKYSTSFSLGIFALSNSIRPAVYAIYGFVRLADEIVDSFHDYDKKELLKRFNSERYKEYILGSAEVVGLMCLQIFVNGDKAQFSTLKPYAMKLGSAFQKINFLRDLKDDFHILGRSYFPHIEMNGFNNDIKKQIENEIALEFKESLVGIKLLPSNSRFGVYLAYKYYLSLFKKIKNLPADKILNERIRIPDGQKLSLAMSSYLQYKMSLL